MGCIFSHLYALVFGNVDDAKVISKKIDKQILQELKNEPDEIDILILGAQEAGKSTLLKQVSIINKRVIVWDRLLSQLIPTFSELGFNTFIG